MNEDLHRMTVRDFAGALSAETPTPSGGSACAIVGALASALVVMTAAFTLGREKYAAVQDEVSRIRNRAEQLRDRCLELATVDAQAYGRVVEARKLPKETPREEEIRRAEIDAALCGATDIPFEIAEAAHEIAELARRAAEIGNPTLRADALAGEELARAVVRGSVEQIKENIGRIRYEDYRRAAEERLARLRA